MTVTEALTELGVTEKTLTEDERAHLRREGYVVLPGMLPPETAARMAQRLDELAAEEGEAAGRDFHTEPGTTRLGSLIRKDALFDVCALHPRALAAVAAVMGDDFGLSSITGRAAQPGEGHQGLHRDNSEPCANALWVISDFTPQNGPTRLVPGTHRSGHDPEKAGDPLAPHPDEVLIIAPAGTLVVIDGWTWHGGTRNATSRTRHLVSAFFTRRGRYQEIADRRLPPAVWGRLSPSGRCVLDHEAIQP